MNLPEAPAPLRQTVPIPVDGTRLDLAAVARQANEKIVEWIVWYGGLRNDYANPEEGE